MALASSTGVSTIPIPMGEPYFYGCIIIQIYRSYIVAGIVGGMEKDQIASLCL